MNLSRVLWKCRKGIREVDILLTSYTKKNYLSLSESEKLNYIEFLDQDTYEIFDMLVNNRIIQKKYINIVKALKSFN